MANICRNTIAVIGLKEPTDEFVKKLSKAMFEIDLDNMIPAEWGVSRCEGGKLYQIFEMVGTQTGELGEVRREVGKELDKSACEEGKYYDVVSEVEKATGKLVERLEEVNPRNWYKKILARKYPPLGVLVPRTPFTRCGVTVPRFYVEKKWKPVYDEIQKASEMFPDLLFHVHYFREQDGPTGEFVMRRGRVLDKVETLTSWYLFDQLRQPTPNLLPGWMELTLAQLGASRFRDAIEAIEQIRCILDDERFIESPFHEYRNGRQLSATRRALDKVLGVMGETASELSFEGVFLEESEAAAIAAKWDAAEEAER